MNITLLHNDDEALDPSDPTLTMRGAVVIDGKTCGVWETHEDGSWTARLSGHQASALPVETVKTVKADGKAALIKLLAQAFSV